jgi:hypothetical protein
MVSDLSNARTLEKLEIERRYWLEHSVDWGIVTEREIPFQKAKNIEWLYSAQDYDLIGNSLIKHEQSREMMIHLLSKNSVTEAARIVEREFQLDNGMGIQIFKQLVINKSIVINLDCPLDLNSGGVTT